MSEHNINTINMYNSGGALEYIHNNEENPETEKWERLFNYIEKGLNNDKSKTIVELGSGCGELAIKLQNEGYNITATDIVDDFLNEQKKIGINKVLKYNFLTDNYDDILDTKADLIVSWRNPHLDMDDMKKLFEVNANILPNGTKYDYKILEDKQTKEKRFYAYFSKEDIDNLRKDLFEINEYHTEGGSEKKNWHVLTLKKIK